MTRPATPPKWTPDPLLVDAVLAGSPTTMADLAKGDREWVVAGCKRAGLTAEETRDRLSCSLRLVRALLADPMADLAALHMDEVEHFTEELRLVHGELARLMAVARAAELEATRVREQRDRLIDAAMVGETVSFCRKRGHVLDRYNVYENPTTGKRQCIACRREDMAELRASRKCGDVVPTTSAFAPAASGALAGGLAGGAPLT